MFSVTRGINVETIFSFHSFRNFKMIVRIHLKLPSSSINNTLFLYFFLCKTIPLTKNFYDNGLYVLIKPLDSTISLNHSSVQYFFRLSFVV